MYNFLGWELLPKLWQAQSVLDFHAFERGERQAIATNVIGVDWQQVLWGGLPTGTLGATTTKTDVISISAT